MFPKKVEYPCDIAIYDMITVIRYCDERVNAARFIRDDLTLDNIEIKGADSIIVIAESPLHGEVYRYGNCGEFWEQIGTVCGYA